MKNIFKNILLAGAFILFIVSPVMTVATPQAVSAACDDGILGIPPWYRGLTDESNDCQIRSPEQFGGFSNFVWRIVLNIVELVLVIIAYIAFFFILYGGFLFITGGGNASQIEKARKSIFNAVIGLIISFGAIAITNLVFNTILTGSTTNSYGVNVVLAEDLLQNSLNLVYYIAGILAVVVIIIAGLSYVTSAGDSGKVTKAKNMILYAVVGLIVIIAAYAITNFVIMRF